MTGEQADRLLVTDEGIERGGQIAQQRVPPASGVRVTGTQPGCSPYCRSTTAPWWLPSVPMP